MSGIQYHNHTTGLTEKITSRDAYFVGREQAAMSWPLNLEPLRGMGRGLGLLPRSKAYLRSGHASHCRTADAGHRFQISSFPARDATGTNKDDDGCGEAVQRSASP